MLDVRRTLAEGRFARCARTLVRDAFLDKDTMTHAAMLAVHAAAAAARERTRVLDAFRINDATAPERARPLAELGLAADDRAMADLVQSGVIRGVDARGRPTVLGDQFARPSAFYLDEGSAIVDRNRGFGNPRRRKLVLAITIGVAVLAAVLALILVLMARAGHYVG